MLPVLLALSLAAADTTKAPADTTPRLSATADTVRRHKAVDLSDWYYRRLEIHRIASYAELPVFATEFWLGDKLMPGQIVSSWVKPTHVGVAATLGGLFAINTITGGWNLYEGWSQYGDRRTLIVAHTAMMLAADGGFAIAPLIAGHRGDLPAAKRHRTVAVVSMGLATISTGMMWLAKR